MDLGQFETTPEFFFSDTPHTVDFYEIFFFKKAKGTLQLDNQVISLQDMRVVFATPYQCRVWNVNREDIEGHYLIFANNFLELLFADPLFVFRLQYFHNHQQPLFVEENEFSLKSEFPFLKQENLSAKEQMIKN